MPTIDVTNGRVSWRGRRRPYLSHRQPHPSRAAESGGREPPPRDPAVDVPSPDTHRAERRAWRWWITVTGRRSGTTRESRRPPSGTSRMIRRRRFASKLRSASPRAERSTAAGPSPRTCARSRHEVEMSEVALAPLQPLLARHATLDLKSGHASASAAPSYQTQGEGPLLRAVGTVSIGDLLMNEQQTGDRFLSWKTMSTDDMMFTLAPNQVRIKEIRVIEPGAKVVISKERKLNFAQVLKAQARPAEPGRRRSRLAAESRRRRRHPQRNESSRDATPRAGRPGQRPKRHGGLRRFQSRAAVLDSGHPVQWRGRGHLHGAHGPNRGEVPRPCRPVRLRQCRGRSERLRSEGIHRRARGVRQRRNASTVAVHRDVRRTYGGRRTALARPALQGRRQRPLGSEQGRDGQLQARRPRGRAERARSAARPCHRAPHRLRWQDQCGGPDHRRRQPRELRLRAPHSRSDRQSDHQSHLRAVPGPRHGSLAPATRRSAASSSIQGARGCGRRSGRSWTRSHTPCGSVRS